MASPDPTDNLLVPPDVLIRGRAIFDKQEALTHLANARGVGGHRMQTSCRKSSGCSRTRSHAPADPAQYRVI